MMHSNDYIGLAGERQASQEMFLMSQLAWLPRMPFSEAFTCRDRHSTAPNNQTDPEEVMNTTAEVTKR